MLYSICTASSFLASKILFPIKVSGKCNIPRRGGFILASNHLSFLDPVVLAVACPRRLNFMARYDLFSNPLFSWLIRSVGAFPVRRNSADRQALKEAMRRVKNGGALLLFPEGSRRSAQEQSHDVEAGIGFLASKLNVPVIPALIKGTDKAMPKGAKFIKPEKVHVYFGKEICVERGMSYYDIAHLIMKNIRHLN